MPDNFFVGHWQGDERPVLITDSSNTEVNIMELVFIQVGLTKAKTLMKYEPEQGGGFDEKSEGFVRLYLFENSSLNAYARLVLTPTSNPEEAHLIWERAGSSQRYIKYNAVETEHMPARWGWNEKLINRLYIPKANPVNSLTSSDGEKLYFVANYGGAVTPNPERAIKEAKPTSGATKSNKELRIRKTLLEGMKIAKVAAQKQLEKLEAQGPKYAAVDSFTGVTHGTLLDDCGGAWIAGVDGRSSLGRIWKKIAQRSDSGFYFGDKLHCGVNATTSQYLSVRRAAAEAFVQYLNANLGTDLYVRTYID